MSDRNLPGTNIRSSDDPSAASSQASPPRTLPIATGGRHRRSLLKATYPEIANATIREVTTDDGQKVVEFLPQPGRKG